MVTVSTREKRGEGEDCWWGGNMLNHKIYNVEWTVAVVKCKKKYVAMRKFLAKNTISVENKYLANYSNENRHLWVCWWPLQNFCFLAFKSFAQKMLHKSWLQIFCCKLSTKVLIQMSFINVLYNSIFRIDLKML